MKAAAKDGWHAKPLEEIATFSNGLWKGKKGPFRKAKILRNTNFRLHGAISFDDVAEIDVECKQFEKRRLRSGDIILERSGGGPKQPVGRVVLFELEDDNYSFSNFTSIIRVVDQSRLDPRFLHQVLNWWHSAGWTERIQSRSTGIRNLDFKAYKQFLVPVLPPLEEQRRIVAILDEAFEGLDRACAQAEANVHASQELFECYLATAFKEIDLEAHQLCLADAATEFGRGRSRHRPRNDPNLYGGDFPFIQTGDVRNCNGFILDYSQTYNDRGLAQSKLWPEGTVCITIAANIAETGILGFEACFPDSVIGMVCDREVTFPEYVEFMLRYFAVDLKAQGKGSAQDNINLGTFERSLFPFPSLELQRKAVNRLQQISDKIDALSKGFNSDLIDFDDLRQSLLQRAFAGELA